MLDAKVKELINKQINQEFYSEYLYLAFANYFYDNGLDGFANWYDVQAQEERDHAMLMRTYLHNNGERVTFSAIAFGCPSSSQSFSSESIFEMFSHCP